MSDIQNYEDDMHSADVLDQASGLTMRHTAAAEQEVRARNAPEKYPDGQGGWLVQVPTPGADPDKAESYPIQYCVGCEDDIPLLRLKMGRIRCTGCQERKENPRKR